MPDSKHDACQGSPELIAAGSASPASVYGQPANDTVTPIAAITIPRAIYAQVIAHLRQALPNEGCGLLAAAGRRDDCRVVNFFPGTNELASSTRYRMAGSEVIDAHRAMRERDWWLAAIVHSHPKGPATPSPTDLREAHFPDAALLIVDLSGPEPEASAWWLSGPYRTVSSVAIRID